MVFKNVVISGVAIVFIFAAFIGWEISRSQTLINNALDPELSITRGFVDAELGFSSGHAHFHFYNQGYPGVSGIDVEKEYKEYSYGAHFFCGTGRSIALDLTNYEINEHYVTAYNTRLLRLLQADN